MAHVELPLPPAVPSRGWHGVLIEDQPIAGEMLFAVTVKPGWRRPARRRWFDRKGAALAFAAEQAERYGLMIFDLSPSGECE